MIQASLAHAAAMAAIHAAAFSPPARWGADAIAIQLGLPGAFGIIAPAGGFVLARVAADEAEVLTLAVDPAARRQGVGQALLRAAMAQAAQAGARAMFLEVAAANAPALALYGQAGFHEVGRRPGYYGSGKDALVMRASCEDRA